VVDGLGVEELGTPAQPSLGVSPVVMARLRYIGSIALEPTGIGEPFEMFIQLKRH